MRKHLFLLFALCSLGIFAQSSSDVEIMYMLNEPFMGYSERASMLLRPSMKHSSVHSSAESPEIRGYELSPQSYWFFRKLLNDHLITFKSKDNAESYFVTFNPVLQVSGGIEMDATSGNRNLFENGRGARLQGRIGESFQFETTLIESQQITPIHMDSYIAERGVVPSQGIAKRFGTSGWDHRWSSGNIRYTPSQYFSFSLGQGRFFYGDGYRSLLLSDNALNYPYFRIETSLGPVKYINLWTQMYDIRSAVNLNPGNRKKWISTHYLSWDVTEKLNLSFFEAVVSRSDTNNAGFDVSYLNPIIFYRPIEDQIDSRLGNAVLGMGASYRVLPSVKAYGQFVLDEFNLSALRASEGSWLNKFGFQLGARYDKQLEIWGGGLSAVSFMAEYNQVRPFTYTHSKTLTNYAHFSQPLAHPLGTDFKEWVFRAQMIHNRWMFVLHYSAAERGLSEVIAGQYYGQGADLWVNYRSRDRDNGFAAGGSPSAMINNFRFETAYEFNPMWRMSLFGTVGYRQGPLYPLVTEDVQPIQSQDSWWFSFGIKTDLYRSYNDI